MIEYHIARLKLSDSQLEKLKSATKNTTGVTQRLSSDPVGIDKKGISIIIID